MPTRASKWRCRAKWARACFVTRSRIARSSSRFASATDLKQLKIGISLNHGGISGQGNPTGVADIELTDETRDSKCSR